ncbi:hypothetical protein CA13_49760 [Planctomycetes bacterium CA13]|uniref:Uncharacterized protein n=1 Tax=Novipirellula herctigrandis TaxID=2527986 RepID=A0A5C5Z9L8_9BACT|nr:hypothetical protein CA13_49760 [Planctomycetes bacterium CA13]
MTKSNPSSCLLLFMWKWRFALLACAVFSAWLLAGPWILAKTPLRNWLLRKIAGSEEFMIESQDASFGYFSSLSLSGIRIETNDNRAKIHVEKIEAERS